MTFENNTFILISTWRIKISARRDEHTNSYFISHYWGKRTFKVNSGTFSWEWKNYFILQPNEASSKDLQMKKCTLRVDRLHEADTQKNCFCFDLKWVNPKWQLFSQKWYILSNFSAPQTTMPLRRSFPGRCITLRNPIRITHSDGQLCDVHIPFSERWPQSNPWSTIVEIFDRKILVIILDSTILRRSR